MAADVEMIYQARARGLSLTQTASAAGVSVKTVQRRLQEPGATERVDELRMGRRESELTEIGTLRTRALSRLVTLIDSDDATVALRAVQMALNVSVIAQQIERLEAQVLAITANDRASQTSLGRRL